ncbi:Asp23/Gls24 family envelope stress response protein [Quadrisphaera sp. KR29]|uniref:Asp23/Gls24 family envelope stress response protein n=1 Tax=Quadrisphaera sp. KR29 TaxID=3461391 RepID=UPI004043FF60
MDETAATSTSGQRRGVRAVGATTTTDAVIATLAGIAAREVPGVHALGTAAERAAGSVLDHLPGTARPGCPGVAVQVGERQAAVEVAVVTELGARAPEVAARVRAAVARALADLVGLEVTAVDVTVVDVADAAPERGRVAPRR